jgi:nitrite reductase/ring-hydroxylating ferredoxin subunit/uncharacterized membrane protein
MEQTTPQRAVQTFMEPAPPGLSDIEPEERLKAIPQYDKYAKRVSKGIHGAVLRGGEPTRTLADLLHGTWLGHPLHSALTDLVIGAWALGSLMDLLSIGGSRRARKTADELIMLGVAAAIPTAVSGLADYSAMTSGAIRTGATHGLINTVALGLYTLSLMSRKAHQRGLGMFLSNAALGLVLVSAWLGGELVYRYRVSVNKAERPKKQTAWQSALDSSSLIEGQARRVEVDKQPVLIYRRDGEIYAIGAVCAHEGGPLDEGKIEGTHVECPWHHSVYDLCTGRVVHGPATYPVPVYETRVREGKVEIRLKD